MSDENGVRTSDGPGDSDRRSQEASYEMLRGTVAETRTQSGGKSGLTIPKNCFQYDTVRP
jgi:hypothetical protein